MYFQAVQKRTLLCDAELRWWWDKEGGRGLSLRFEGFLDGRLWVPRKRRTRGVTELFICISFPIYYLTGHSTSSQAAIEVTSAPRRNLDLHAQLLVLEMSLTSTLASKPSRFFYATFSW